MKKTVILMIVTLAFAFALGCKPQGESVTPDGAKQMLQLRGYEINAKGYYKAIEAEDLAAIRTFFQTDLDPNMLNEKGDTPLTFALSCCELKTIRVVAEKTDVNLRDKSGNTPLYLALTKHKKEFFDFFMGKNPDVNVPGKDDRTVLHIAAARDDLDLIKTFIERGANVNAIDKDNLNIPMIDSCIGDRPQAEAIRLFLSKGADINQQGKNKATCLIYVAAGGHADLAAELLQAGADPKLKDEDGMTALDWAVKTKHPEVAAVLKAK